MSCFQEQGHLRGMESAAQREDTAGHLIGARLCEVSLFSLSTTGELVGLLGMSPASEPSRHDHAAFCDARLCTSHFLCVMC